MNLNGVEVFDDLHVLCGNNEAWARKGRAILPPSLPVIPTALAPVSDANSRARKMFGEFPLRADRDDQDRTA